MSWVRLLERKAVAAGDDWKAVDFPQFGKQFVRQMFKFVGAHADLTP